MTFDRSLLHYLVRDAVRKYSEKLSIVSQDNPAQIILNSRRYSVHVSFVHDSGNHRDNEDEVRIQISRTLIEEQRKRAADGQVVAFVGFFDDGKAFVAWDPRHVFSLEAKKVVSVYARQSQRQRVFAHLAAVHDFHAKFLDETSFAIALPSYALGFYLENVEHFHRVRTERGLQSLMQNQAGFLAEFELGVQGELELEDAGERELFIYTRTGFKRDPRFSLDVLDAYERTCCVCGRQLGLVQAAHIIPHSEPDSPNSVNNGLALCIEHHRLYDDALLLPGPNRKLIFNARRGEYLHQTRQQRGLDEIAAKDGSEYCGPDNRAHEPNEDYLKRGLAIRLGE